MALGLSSVVSSKLASALAAPESGFAQFCRDSALTIVFLLLIFVATRQSSSKLDSALAAPKLASLIFVATRQSSSKLDSALAAPESLNSQL